MMTTCDRHRTHRRTFQRTLGAPSQIAPSRARAGALTVAETAPRATHSGRPFTDAPSGYMPGPGAQTTQGRAAGEEDMEHYSKLPARLHTVCAGAVGRTSPTVGVTITAIYSSACPATWGNSVDMQI